MKVGVIGCGNLGKSFVKGLLKTGKFEPKNITVTDLEEEKLERIRKFGVKTTTDNEEAARKSSAIFLAVKPDLVGGVLDELELSEDKLLISLAAGVSTNFLRDHTDARIVRVMPNICGSVSKMASAYTLSETASEEDGRFIEDILTRLGGTIEVGEDLMNVVTGLSGSGPAYVFLIIEALKEAGEEAGLSEEEALWLAALTVEGSGKLVLNSNMSLDELVNVVCSPKGTTIEGVKVLEERGIQKALKEAVKAAAERAGELSK